jgi:hypothetical protein
MLNLTKQKGRVISSLWHTEHLEHHLHLLTSMTKSLFFLIRPALAILSFCGSRIDGSARPLWPDGLPYERARESIDILNLNKIETVERRKYLINKCFRYVERANRIFAYYQNDPRAAYQEFKQLVQEIQDLITPSAEYSAAVRAFLSGLTYEWVKGLVK